MNIRVNGFRAGVMATLLAIGGASCKKVPYKPMPKEQISAKMEHVVDSFYNVGLELQNNPEYQCIHRDTIRFKDAYINHPKRLEKNLTLRAMNDKYPSDEADIGFLYYTDPQYVVSSTDIFTKNGKPYIAIAEYDKR